MPTPSFAPDAPRPLWPALRRGFSKLCPRCGAGRIFSGYVKVRPGCDRCTLDLSPQQADDAPAYFTIVIVGHVVVPAMLMVEQGYAPPLFVHYALWLPLAFVMTLWLLPRVKGVLIALQWARAMHGFGSSSAPPPERTP